MILGDGYAAVFLVLGVVGVVGFVVLNLIIALCECFVLRLMVGIHVKASYLRVLGANVLSGVLGLIIYRFQDSLLESIGVRTIPDFLYYYSYAAIFMLAIYYVESVLVETWVIVQPGFMKAVGVGRRRLWFAVAAANVVSYVVLGPMYYYATRPTFDGVQPARSPAEIAACNDRVFFLHPATRHICAIRADGTDFQDLVPQRAVEFIVSSDERMFVYRGTDDNLCAFESGWKDPRLIWRAEGEYFLNSVAISPDHRRVTYAKSEGRYEIPESERISGQRRYAGLRDDMGERFRRHIQVFNLGTGSVEAECEVVGWEPQEPFVVWDPADSTLIHVEVCGQVRTWRLTDGGLTDLSERREPVVSTSYQRLGDSRYFQGKFYGTGTAPTDFQGDLTLKFPTVGLTGYLKVTCGEREIFFLDNDYDFLRFGGPYDASFLSSPGRIVFAMGDGHIYVLDVASQRVAWLVQGRGMVLTSRRFQQRLEPAAQVTEAYSPNP
jgi:hypothetical protein